MPRKKKSRNQDVSDLREDDGKRHLYVAGNVPPGHDVPVIDLYFEFAKEDFEEKMRRMLREAEQQKAEAGKE